MKAIGFSFWALNGAASYALAHNSPFNFDDLDKVLNEAKIRSELSLIEVKCSIGARINLGRPTTSAINNRICFMECLNSLSEK